MAATAEMRLRGLRPGFRGSSLSAMSNECVSRRCEAPEAWHLEAKENMR